MKVLEITQAPAKYTPEYEPVKHSLNKFMVDNKEFKCTCGGSEFHQIKGEYYIYGCATCGQLFDIVDADIRFEYYTLDHFESKDDK